MSSLLRNVGFGEQSVVVDVGARVIGLEFDSGENAHSLFDTVTSYLGPAPLVDQKPDFVVQIREGEIPKRLEGKPIEVSPIAELRNNGLGTWQVWSPDFAAEWSERSGVVIVKSGTSPHGGSLALSLLLLDVARGSETMPFHAGLVRNNSETAMLLGASGQGKSTTISAAAQRGFTICSDDAMFVDLAGPPFRARCLPRTPMLPVESLNLSAADSAKIASQLDYRQRLMAVNLPVDTDWHDLTAIVLVCHGDEDDSGLLQARRTEILRALVKSLTARFEQQALLDELAGLAELPIYRLALGKNAARRPETTASCLDEILGQP